jgi:hypothetical protein
MWTNKHFMEFKKNKNIITLQDSTADRNFSSKIDLYFETIILVFFAVLCFFFSQP